MREYWKKYKRSISWSLFAALAVNLIYIASSFDEIKPYLMNFIKEKYETTCGTGWGSVSKIQKCDGFIVYQVNYSFSVTGWGISYSTGVSAYDGNQEIEIYPCYQWRDGADEKNDKHHLYRGLSSVDGITVTISDFDNRQEKFDLDFISHKAHKLKS